MSEWPITIVRMGADVDSKGDPIEYDWWHEIPAEKVDALRSHGYEVVVVVPAEPEAKAPGPAPSGGTGSWPRWIRVCEKGHLEAGSEPVVCWACYPGGRRTWEPGEPAQLEANMVPVKAVPAERSDGPDVSPPSAGSGLEESATRELGDLRAENDELAAEVEAQTTLATAYKHEVARLREENK